MWAAFEGESENRPPLTIFHYNLLTKKMQEAFVVEENELGRLILGFDISNNKANIVFESADQTSNIIYLFDLLCATPTHSVTQNKDWKLIQDSNNQFIIVNDGKPKKFVLVNSSGMLIKDFSFQNSFYELSLHDCSDGIYYLIDQKSGGFEQLFICNK